MSQLQCHGDLHVSFRRIFSVFQRLDRHPPKWNFNLWSKSINILAIPCIQGVPTTNDTLTFSYDFRLNYPNSKFEAVMQILS